MSDAMDQEEFDDVEIPREQQLAVLKVVDRFAEDMADKVLLCRILGIIPSATPVDPAPRVSAAPVRNQGRCVECGVPTASSKGQGGAVYGGLGRCQRCYMRMRRDRAAEAK